MKLTGIHIKNFKAIHEMKIDSIENALILVGQNNTGKTTILEAIRAAFGDYHISAEDFDGDCANIEMVLSLEFSIEDLKWLHQNGIVSQYKRYETWLEDFCKKLPSFSVNEGESGGVLQFTFIAHRDGWVRYQDGEHKNNSCIPQVFPKIYYLDAERDLNQLQGDLLMLQEDELLKRMRADTCMFNQAKKCGHCFSCIGLIEKKTPAELDAFETAKLLDYKLYQLNLDEFARKVNQNYKKNGGQDEILYSMNRDVERMLKVTTEIHNPAQNLTRPVAKMGKGMRSIYMLSLLETYINSDNDTAPYIIMIEEPETYLHPQLQKIASEILYRLSKKNQVIFSTHEPEMLFNFTTKQIRQIYCDEFHMTAIRKDTDIDDILNDLGFTANDMMNVSFVFIVEGKQDRSRLPLLLNKYYSEVYDENGRLRRIAIISTNSCTNIKTYANLKYINTLYLKDQFMMIRDSDGKDKQMLGKQLCRYYGERAKEDKGNMPRVTDRNVLILKYYSFENYFLFPEIMEKVGVVKSVDKFYDILWEKYNQYLYKLTSVKKMLSKLDISIDSRNDLIANIENIRIYVRGHNLYDIFYGRFKANENDVLSRYIELAPREIFADILDKIDGFVYFDSRRR